MTAEKYYVIPRGKRQSYVAMVHREGCPLLKQMKHAHVWDRNPLDEDKFGYYQRCKRCWPDSKGKQHSP